MTRSSPGGALINRRRDGFTLLEMLLVCAIIIITVAAVSASMGGLLTRSHLRTSAARISSLAVYARSQALTSGHKVVMQVDPEAGEVTLLQPEGSAGALSSMGEDWRTKLPQGIAIDALEIDGEAVAQGEIAFYPEGGAQAARIVLGAGGEDRSSRREQRVLEINKITGRVKAE